MKEINIKRDSKLFKTVAFLSEVPLFSMFIRSDYYSGYSTFSDVCTFCRHLIYSLLASLVYVAIVLALILLLIVEPVKVLLGSASVFGTITLGLFGVLFAFYVVLLIIQNAFAPLVSFWISKFSGAGLTDAEQEEKKDSILRSVKEIVSEKHDAFCKRIKVERVDD